MKDATNPLAGFLSAGEGAAGLSAVDRILDAVRKHLGMNVAFASRYVNGRREFTHIQADIPVPASPGDSEPQENTACYRILTGQLPELMHDAAEYPLAAELPIVPALPVGAHLNVPLRLRDGSVYGSFCCISQRPDRSLTQRDLATVRAFADLAIDQIERDNTRDHELEVARNRIEGVMIGDAITIHYQPIHALSDGRPVGVESLARFPLEEGGPRCPSTWFAAAADVGMGIELELRAIRQALRGLPYIPDGLYVALNASPETVLSGELPALLAGAPAGRLVVEVTEHAQIDDYDALNAALAAIRPHARIAIDDVGAGYSGLRHLVDLKPDLLKLDMGLTRKVDTDQARHALVQAMVAFAARLGSRIIAEGVETAAEAATLRQLGVPFAQGWHYSRAMPAVAVQQFLIGAAAAPEAPARVMPLPRRAVRR